MSKLGELQKESEQLMSLFDKALTSQSKKEKQNALTALRDSELIANKEQLTQLMLQFGPTVLWIDLATKILPQAIAILENKALLIERQLNPQQIELLPTFKERLKSSIKADERNPYSSFFSREPSEFPVTQKLEAIDKLFSALETDEPSLLSAQDKAILTNRAIRTALDTLLEDESIGPKLMRLLDIGAAEHCCSMSQ